MKLPALRIVPSTFAGVAVASALLVGLLVSAPPGLSAQEGTGARLMPLGVTGLSWGAWTTPGARVEDWVDQARGLCRGEEYCRVNVFEGAELATHEDPVPEESRSALKWVFEYRENESPKVVVEAAHPGEDGKKQRWTFE